MSHTYQFVCVDCRETVDLGKIVALDKQGRPRPLGFGGWRDQRSGDWIQDGNLWRLLERWHILHRGHEIRLVPRVFLARANLEDRLTDVLSLDDVLERAVEPSPDDEADSERLTKEISDRLRRE